jgi:uncharacterized membrane protein YsdA (DUF1294 family)
MKAPSIGSIIVVYLVIINVAAYLTFAWDKHRARYGLWRVAESNLLTLALMGGTIGALAGRRILRHKIRKEPFGTYLATIGGAQLVLLIALSLFATG